MASLNFQASHVSRDLDMDNRTSLHSLMIRYNYHIYKVGYSARKNSVPALPRESPASSEINFNLIEQLKSFVAI